jgi:putative proteasome-type protease
MIAASICRPEYSVTYCVAITVDRGLVFASDSRTNAGVDQVSTFSKMHTLVANGDRMITLLSSGNLATTQAVVRRLRRDMENNAPHSLLSVKYLAEAAEYVGDLNREQRARHRNDAHDSFNPEASFILGGQITGREPQIYLVYPEGNHIRASGETPYLQIGEVKYGKPILDRIIQADLPLQDAARCALVSMDSTMRSNVTVGPPIELLMYDFDGYGTFSRLMLQEDDDYLRALRRGWDASLKRAFQSLPGIPVAPAPRIRLVDK